jgi:hypothetical protein
MVARVAVKRKHPRSVAAPCMYHRGRMDRDFIEDELNTFEGWLRYQHFSLTEMSPDELVTLRRLFDDTMREKANRRPMGRMKLKPLAPGELRYAVAVREADGLWLVLWIRRSPEPAVFIMHPTGESERDVHTSYHRNGTLHMKSFDRIAIRSYKRQPLTASFQGTEHLGAESGFAPHGVGAICDPADFTGVVEVPFGVLGVVAGSISVDLVEPGKATTWIPWSQVVMRKVFRETAPWLVVTIRRSRETNLP